MRKAVVDVVGPVTVLTRRDLLAQHTAERLELQVAVDVLALVLRRAPRSPAPKANALAAVP
jgi:hypothetical protein